MSFFTSLGTTLTNLLSNPATVTQGTNLLTSLTNSSQMNTEISNLLMQLQANPAVAAQIAAQIAAIPGVPAQIMGYVNALPQVANDKVQLAVLTAQIQAALPHSTLFG